MKIGMLIGNTGFTRSGIGNYIDNLTSELEKTSEHEITLIAYDKPSITSDLPVIYPYYPFLIYKTVLWSQMLSLQKGLLKDFDIVHNPGHFSLINKPGRHYICTIHDLTPIISPIWHTRWKYLVSKISFPRIIAHSDRIIVDSFQTKKDLIRCYHVREQNISVIYLGASEEFKPLDIHHVESVKKKYMIDFPFVLFVGNLEPRKNLPTLLKAFSQCKKKIPELKLIIIGQKGWKYAEVFKTIRFLHLEKEVIFLQYVAHEDLPALYNAALLFVYPSLYEGFGLPPLEAMQCGIPVITSNTSSLSEVIGDGGFMVDPLNVSDLADKMLLLLTDDQTRKENIRYNLARCRQFSWEKCAQQTLKVYEEVCKT
jgi:glycosyltransferase involved in cell wall biosynthesis